MEKKEKERTVKLSLVPAKAFYGTYISKAIRRMPLRYS